MLELVVVMVAGFSAGGMAYLANRLTGGRLPRWLVPVSAGVAMLSYAIWSEYSWFPRVAGALPESVVVVSQNETSAFWRPWTYALPVTTRFIALDRASVTQASNATPRHLLANVYLLARSLETIGLVVLFDCDGARRADLLDGATVSSEGQLQGGVWRDLDRDDPMLLAACVAG